MSDTRPGHAIQDRQANDGMRRGDVIVFHGGALGDLVNTLPALVALKRGREGRVTAVGNLAYLTLFESAGVVDRAVSLDFSGMHSLFGGTTPPSEIADLISGHALAVSWMRSRNLLESLLGLGLDVAAMTAPFPPPPGAGHITNYMASLLKDLGLEVPDLEPRLNLPPSIAAAAPDFNGIVIHPGSGSPKKNFPPSLFARTARRLAAETGLPLAVLEGPADRAPAAALIDELGATHARRFGGLSIFELAGLLSRSTLLLGNDSGVCHLAGALGTPVVALFGPTDPAVWGVRQRRAANLSSDAVCRPCAREEMQKCAARDCLNLDPEPVVNAALALLDISGTE